MVFFWLFFCVLRPTNKAAVQQKSAKMEVGIADDQVLYIIDLQYCSKLKVAKLEGSPALKPKTFLFTLLPRFWNDDQSARTVGKYVDLNKYLRVGCNV